MVHEVGDVDGDATAPGASKTREMYSSKERDSSC